MLRRKRQPRQAPRCKEHRKCGTSEVLWPGLGIPIRYVAHCRDQRCGSNEADAANKREPRVQRKGKNEPSSAKPGEPVVQDRDPAHRGHAGAMSLGRRRFYELSRPELREEKECAQEDLNPRTRVRSPVLYPG